MNNWLNHFKINLVQSHCSGHINGVDMKELLELINPKSIYPIHTERPGLFRDLSMKTKMIKEGVVYNL